MDFTEATPAIIQLPPLPVSHGNFIAYLKQNEDTPMSQLLAPYKRYDNEMRKVFAQQSDHTAAEIPSIVPIFNGSEGDLKVRARDLAAESDATKASFMMPLGDDQRLAGGSLAVVPSLSAFRTNFNVFSESSLVDMDWSNVVVAGSAVVTSLLAVPEQYAGTKRALREYYHDKVAPASDVDLFMYGFSEDQAKIKIKQIEISIRDSILTETTTVRTKNAITIVSQYPTRHVQIVLRIYKTISEILTGFDVDCSCAAYNGKQVYASPRAIAAFMTQINTIDLTRRSPSYESRLSKYAHRGFEISWPDLDRSRIDPTIFERSFGRTEGLARLLILEKLPRSEDRDAYLDQRRAERGRPAINRWRMNSRRLHGNIKDAHEDEVADWVNAEDVSDYHTFTIPYGPKFHARKIEKLLFTKDMLLNAEWNLPKDREVHLHRHPAFFGRAEDVFHDCCGSCPRPKTVEEEEVFEEESKIYVSGDVGFIKDDPGRQAIGSFHPITPAGWTEMAYVGNTARLCQAIVERDVDYVRTWLEQEGNDPNTRDFTGRTPLHLAVADSSLEVVQQLIDHNARLIARLVDGKTALHLAAMRGNVDIISALLRRSETNEEEEQKKIVARRATRAGASDNILKGELMTDMPAGHQAAKEENENSDNDSDIDIDMMDDSDESDLDATTENSMVKVKPPVHEADDKALEGDSNTDEPDIYDVNVLAWDTAVSPLHLAIVNGHIDAVRCLVQDFGADLMLPVKLYHEHDKSARAAVLTLVLALQLPLPRAEAMTRALIKLGASCAQADMDQNTTLHTGILAKPELIQSLYDADPTGVSRAINHLSVSGYQWNPTIASPLMTAINARDSQTALRLLGLGAKPNIEFSAYIKAYQTKNEVSTDSKENNQQFQRTLQQPVVCAVQCELPDLAGTLIEDHGVDPNTLTASGWKVLNDQYSRKHTNGSSLLDEVHAKIKELAEWKPIEDEVGHAPIALDAESTYMSGLTKGSYAWWSARRQLTDAKEKYDREMEAFQKKSEEVKTKIGVSEKQDAVNAMLAQFETLAELLIKRGAKTFKDLHPDINGAEEWPHLDFGRRNPTPAPSPFQLDFSFKLPDLSDEASERYMQLFESSWVNDWKKVKELTMLTWKSIDGEDQPPLKIAVLDQHKLSPFAIAVLHGHFELATMMMEIAQAQFVPPDAPQRRRHILVDADDSDSDSESNMRIVSELVDDTFTVETVGQISTQTQSRVSPHAMLLRTGPIDLFGDGRSKESSKSSLPARCSLLQYAVHFGDEKLLEYLLSLAEKYNNLSSSAEDADKFFALPQSVYDHAIAVDRPHILAKLIKRTGAGIPMDQLVKQSGVEVEEKSKYYQGLSVYGTKRRDWAARGRKYQRNYHDALPLNSSRPPLLQAAYKGSLETVEWLLSDAPIRYYNEFAKANSEDKRIQSLSDIPGGFEACVQKFLGARSHLIIHCCIMGKPTPDALALLRYLVRISPDCIEAKSQELMTPLHVAFRLHRVEAAEILIAAGADQTARDKSSNNIIHHLLKRRFASEEKLHSISSMLNLINKNLLPTLFLERCADLPGSLTPLAQIINPSQAYHYYNGTDYSEEVIRTILQYSKGVELNSINGEGHTPLHVYIRENQEALTKIVLDHDSTLLLRENATGRTPFEMAEDSHVAVMVTNPPSLEKRNRMGRRNWKVRNQPICDRPAEDFVDVECSSDSSPQEKIWEFLQQTKAKLAAEGFAQRRLVTLNEANEVAKRLADRKLDERKFRGRQVVVDVDDGGDDDGQKIDGEQKVMDEVQIWMWD